MANLHHLQDTYSVREPPTTGPIKIPIWPIDIMTPINANRCQFMYPPEASNLPGRLWSGALALIIVNAPLVMPDDPNPATVRPIINIFELTAAPHSTDPNSKMPRKARKQYLELSRE